MLSSFFSFAALRSPFLNFKTASNNWGELQYNASRKTGSFSDGDKMVTHILMLEEVYKTGQMIRVANMQYLNIQEVVIM